MPDPATYPDPVADKLAAIQLRAENVRECPPGAPDALWRSVHRRSAADVPYLLAAVERVLGLAGSWEANAPWLGPTDRAFAARVIRVIRREISRAFLGEETR